MGVFREDLREGGEMGCVRRISCRVYVRIFRVCMLRCAIYAWDTRTVDSSSIDRDWYKAHAMALCSMPDGLLLTGKSITSKLRSDGGYM